MCLTGVIIGSRVGDLVGYEGREPRAKEKPLTLIRLLPKQTQQSFRKKEMKLYFGVKVMKKWI